MTPRARSSNPGGSEIPLSEKVKAWITAGRFFALPWLLVNTLAGACLAGFAPGILGGDLCGVGRRLAAALETLTAGR